MKDAQCETITSALSPLIKGICFYQDVLKIEDRSQHDVYSLWVSPHMADMPVLVGSDGRHIRALRYIVAQAARKFDLREPKHYEDLVILKESYIGEAEPDRQPVPNPNFDCAALRGLAMDLIGILFKRPDLVDVQIEDRPDKVKVYVEARDSAEVSYVNALADVFFPWGKRQGKRVEIRLSRNADTQRFNHASNPLRNREVPRHKRVESE